MCVSVCAFLESLLLYMSIIKKLFIIKKFLHILKFGSGFNKRPCVKLDLLLVCLAALRRVSNFNLGLSG